MFGLMNLLKVIILIINSIAILSEDRFLARIGWSAQSEPSFGSSGGDASIKAKMINLISAVRMLMRIPLIGINLLIILHQLVLG